MTSEPDSVFHSDERLSAAESDKPLSSDQWSEVPELLATLYGVVDRLESLFRNLSTTLRHRRFLFTDSFLLLWKWRVG